MEKDRKKDSGLEFASILLWGDTLHLVEHADEVVLVVEPQGIGHLLDGQVGGIEQELGTLHFLTVDVLDGRKAELMTEELDEVGLGDMGYLRQFFEVDALADAVVDVAQDPFHAFVAGPDAGCGLAEEVGDNHEHGAAQLHLLPQRHVAVALQVSGNLCRVVVTTGIGMWQTGIGLLPTDIFKEMLGHLGGLHLGRQVIDFLYVHVVLKSLIDMEIIETEGTVTLVRMDGVGWDDIEMAGVQRHVGVRQVQQRLALQDIEDADERRTDILPVPIGIVVGTAHIEQHEVHRLDRYLEHRGKY